MPNGTSGTELTQTNYTGNQSGDAEFIQYVPGLLVESSDLMEMQDAVRALIGDAIAQLTGTLDFILWSGFDLKASGMNVTAGGQYSWLFLRGRLLTYCPAVTFTVNAADPSQQRIDAIYAKYVEITDAAAPLTGRKIKQNGAVQSNQTAYRVFDSYDLVYEAGTPGASSYPTGPAGYVAIATITVPAGATALQQTNLKMLLPYVSQVLQGVLPPLSSDTVTSVDKKHGDLLVYGHDGIDVDDGVGPHEIHLRLPQPYVGQSFCKFARVPLGDGTTTVTLPVLPGTSACTYNVIAKAMMESSAACTLTGSGASWDISPLSVPDQNGVDPGVVIGTAVGGQQPSMSYDVSGSIGSSSGAIDVLEIWAVCTYVPEVVTGGGGIGSTTTTLGATLVVAGAASTGGTGTGGGGNLGGTGSNPTHQLPQ